MQRVSYERARPSRSRRIWRGFLLLLVILAILVHAGGGWYAASRIYDDALAIKSPVATQNVRVVAVSADTVTLEALPGADSPVFDPGIYGLDYGNGYVRLATIVGVDDQMVTRTYTVVQGSEPSVGANADMSLFAYPADPAASNLAVRYVQYPTELGPMDAWKIDGTSTWVIHVHGKGSSPQEAIRLMVSLADAGYSQLAIDYRNDPGQPKDPSGVYQYGATEREDLQAAIDYAQEEGAEQVFVVGYSTGAAIALATIYRDPSVSAAVFDSPNLDMTQTIAYGARKERVFGLPVPPTVTEVGMVLTSLRTGINWKSTNYLDRADQVSIPILVFHGTADTVVPIEESRRLVAARPDLVMLVEEEGARHVGSWNVDPEGYGRRVLDFLVGISAAG